MNCREFQKHLDNLLCARPGDETLAEMTHHAGTCPQCARDYQAALEALDSVQLSYKVQPSSDLKERIMNGIVEVDSVHSVETPVRRRSRISFMKMAWAGGVALALTLAVLGLFGRKNGLESGFALLAQARAAEASLYSAKGFLHLVNEILVQPVADPDMARMRWTPMVSLEANGKNRFHQLALSAKPGERYTVDDQSWYDPASGRFVRVLSAGGNPVFANAFDGTAVYSLGTNTDKPLQVVRTVVSEGFERPSSPAAFLGIGAGLTSGLDEKNEKLVTGVENVILDDGAAGRAVKVATPANDAPGADTYVVFTIRNSDNLIARVELVIGGKSQYVIRRVRSEVVGAPKTAWDLSDLKIGPAKPGAAGSSVKITPDMVESDVPLRQMVEKADFATYVFSPDPAGTAPRQITDILDIVSPPHRGFAVTHCAKDGRHVVLMQSYSYNTMLGPMVKTGRLVYQSPKGIKVWSGPKDKWLAGILLQSARWAIKDAPVENRTGYLLETPDGTFPALAVNGALSDAELHSLVDSLVPAKNVLEK